MVDRRDKESRRASKRKMEYALQLGTNILMYPEGVWNKTENLLVQKLYPGIYEVAKNTGAVIMPLATIEENGIVYAIIDAPFDITEYEQQDGLDILRDKMASSKYELIEKYAFASRRNIGDPIAYWNAFLERLVASAHGHYDYQIENSAQFKDKTITEPSDAFAHLNLLSPCNNNAFLLSKNNHQ